MPASSPPQPVVETTAGRVAGRVAEAWPGGPPVLAFRGVPFGAAPVGPLRFRPPEPAPPWSGVRPAAEPGPAPPQVPGDPMSSLVPGASPGTTSEADCLNLDVWAPADLDAAARRPVMVWVPGGAFRIGASSLPTYDAGRLAAEQDVVVVSPNYRLGALGFLYVPSAGDAVAPNCGLSDLMLALRWVAANAAAFGGDPTNVTVFGESAGAGAILHLLAAPATGGLFHRAILQSPGVSQALDREQAALVAERLLHRLSLPPDGAGLHTVEVERLLAAQEAVVAELAASVGAMPFHPVPDGRVVAEPPLAAIGAGRGVPVVAVVGTCEDEMQLFAVAGMDALDHARMVAVLHPVVSQAVGHDPGPDAVHELVTSYERWVGEDGGGPAEVWGAVMTDGLMRLPAEQLLAAHAAGGGGETRAYSFAWKPGGRAAPMRSFHAVDLPFTFGTFDREGWREFLGAGPDAEGLSTTMRRAWAAFARDGRPDRVLSSGWDRWQPVGRSTLVLADPVRQVVDPLAERRTAWESIGKAS
jgi:para-nitrobenzyl esterase